MCPPASLPSLSAEAEPTVWLKLPRPYSNELTTCYKVAIIVQWHRIDVHKWALASEETKYAPIDFKTMSHKTM